MPARIKLLRSATPGAVPDALESGQIAINEADGKLFWRRTDGAVLAADLNIEARIEEAIGDLVNSAPTALDTLQELAAALGNDANFASTVTNALAGKVPTTRTISASGLATGGGSLSDDRTFSVPAASQAEAEAGTDNTKAMTPLRVAQAVSALAPEGVPPARQIQTSGLATGGGDLSADRTIDVPAASQAEAETGTDNAKAMTALRTAQAIAAQGSTKFQPIPSSVSYPVGTLILAMKSNSGGVNEGATIAGSNLRRVLFGLDSSGVLTIDTGAGNLSGTWMNVSGHQINQMTNNTNRGVGYFVRTA
ncbi:hypothetical protein [Pseudorhodoplanes sp.]|uniref:hypothetical protein n=1 Tax=Pseudorhodoplanes sp. TaxID=1934341 RepID=UPI00391AF342